MKVFSFSQNKYVYLALLLCLVVIIFFSGIVPAKTNIAAREVAIAAQKIRSAFASKGSYWGLCNNFLESNDILTNYRYKDGILVNILGKPVLFGKGENAEVIMPGDKSFDVVYADLSAKECQKLSAYRFEQPETLGLLQVTIVSDKPHIFEWGSQNNRLPVEQHKAKQLCSDKSKVIWTFE